MGRRLVFPFFGLIYRLWFILQDTVNPIHHRIIQYVHMVQALQVLFKLLNLGCAQDDRAYVLIFQAPAQCQVDQRQAQLFSQLI